MGVYFTNLSLIQVFSDLKIANENLLIAISYDYIHLIFIRYTCLPAGGKPIIISLFIKN